MPPVSRLLEPPTPGPWTVYRSQRPPERLFIHGPKGESVGMIFERDNFPGWENAHWAASAPALVDLLLCAVDEFESHNGRYVDGPHWSVDAAALLDLLGAKS